MTSPSHLRQEEQSEEVHDDVLRSEEEETIERLITEAWQHQIMRIVRKIAPRKYVKTLRRFGYRFDPLDGELLSEVEPHSPSSTSESSSSSD